jgi:hypothetical protein
VLWLVHGYGGRRALQMVQMPGLRLVRKCYRRLTGFDGPERRSRRWTRIVSGTDVWRHLLVGD